jgi:hypothetical protein
MRPLKIDCADGNWKMFLKRNLQEGIEVDLLGLDYLVDGQFCEILAISHSMTLRLDVRNKVGSFRKRGPSRAAKKQIIPLPLPGQS